jgi:small ligand-binding sensory domain FIST
MDDFIPKPGSIKIGGLSRKAQKLQAMRDKAAAQKDGGSVKQHAANSSSAPKANAFTGHKKTSFNRKAV